MKVRKGSVKVRKGSVKVRKRSVKVRKRLRERVLDSKKGLGFEKGSWIRERVLDSKKGLGFEKGSWRTSIGFLKKVGRIGGFAGHSG